jgi:hypothetical protein
MKFEIILSCETEDGVIVSLNETLSQAQFFELLNSELLGDSESASKVRKCIYAMVDTRKRAELIAQVHSKRMCLLVSFMFETTCYPTKVLSSAYLKGWGFYLCCVVCTE